MDCPQFVRTGCCSLGSDCPLVHDGFDAPPINFDALLEDDHRTLDFSGSLSERFEEPPATPAPLQRVRSLSADAAVAVPVEQPVAAAARSGRVREVCRFYRACGRCTNNRCRFRHEGPIDGQEAPAAVAADAVPERAPFSCRAASAPASFAAAPLPTHASGQPVTPPPRAAAMYDPAVPAFVPGLRLALAVGHAPAATTTSADPSLPRPSLHMPAGWGVATGGAGFVGAAPQPALLPRMGGAGGWHASYPTPTAATVGAAAPLSMSDGALAVLAALLPFARALSPAAAASVGGGGYIPGPVVSPGQHQHWMHHHAAAVSVPVTVGGPTGLSWA